MRAKTICPACKGANDRQPQTYCSACRRAYNAGLRTNRTRTTCSKCKGPNDRPSQNYCSTCRAAYNLAQRTRRWGPSGELSPEQVSELIAKGPRWPADAPPRLAKCSTWNVEEENRAEIPT